MKVYFDMDGVLADFDRGVRELCGMEPSDLNNPDEAHDSLMWEKIREVDHFCFRLEPMPGMLTLFDAVRHRIKEDCQILTSIPKPKWKVVTAGEDKKNWVKKYLSEDVKVNVVLKKEKKNHVTDRNCILIDDMEENIREWEEYGGTGILFRDPERLHRRLRELGIIPGKGGDAEFLIRRDTKVLSQIGDSDRYMMTNDQGEVTLFTRVFFSSLDGDIGLNGHWLGSIYNHDPYLIPKLVEVNRRFEDLNPGYFERMAENSSST